MTIQITNDVSNDPLVDTELLVRTIETNRDRIRTSANMLLTLAGIVISACLGFALFVVERQAANKATLICFIVSSIFFLLAAYFAISSSFLRTQNAISGQSQFVSDLLALFYRELRLLKISTRLVLVGLMGMLIGVLAFIVQNWR